jgi:hypothetical protein
MKKNRDARDAMSWDVRQQQQRARKKTPYRRLQNWLPFESNKRDFNNLTLSYFAHDNDITD